MEQEPQGRATQSPPGFVTEEVAATMLGKRVSTLRRWARQGGGPPRIKVGQAIFYRLKALTDWLVDQEVCPDAGRGRRYLDAQ